MNKDVNKQRVALLGLGTMGIGMAGRLLGAGFSLSVFNRTAQKAKELAGKGARVAETPREAAAGADVIVSMVADDDASRSMWLGEHGALAAVSRGAVLVEASTLSTAWVAELAQAAARQGCELLDTPVTGSKPQAAAGELLFLVGGSSEALEKARPVLAVMSRGLVHVGPSGSGALLKLINNFLCGIQAAALGEALALIAKGGLNQEKAFEVLTNGAPGSPLMKTLLSRLSTGVDLANFRLVLMTKDLAYGLKEAERRGVAVPMVSTAHGLFTEAVKSGLGEKDFAAVAGPLKTER
jgi:3-hydroxyisobutyrate dehydrogenase